MGTISHEPDRGRALGRQADGLTVFGLSAAEVGLDALSGGRFGFYNDSQAPVRGNRFTKAAAATLVAAAALFFS